ncbi:hypothetical protein B0H10DRAFT_1959624 [Mycena sp. CBHHK59/15]|nr:hypothetical protein B0H10DRAFT_1959624 [Mycena sp. CBHHK59/15]
MSRTNYSKSVDLLMKEWLQESIDSNGRLLLLQDDLSLRRTNHKYRSLQKKVALLNNGEDSSASRGLDLSTALVSSVAVEVLRYVNCAHQPMPRSDRLCRFCKLDVENPDHVLHASFNAVVQLCSPFWFDYSITLDTCSDMELLKAAIFPTHQITGQNVLQRSKLFWSQACFEFYCGELKYCDRELGYGVIEESRNRSVQ